MPETTYTYSKAVDFPSGIDTSHLRHEILTSSIVTSLQYINTNGDTVYVVFQNALSASEKITLDGNVSNPAGGLIATHDATVVHPGSLQGVYTAESDIEQGTTSNSYVTKVTLNTPKLAAGKYRVAWSAVISYDSLLTALSARLYNVTDSQELSLVNFLVKDLADEYQVGGINYLNFNNNLKQIAIQWKSNSLGIAAYMRLAKIELWKVDS